MKKRELEQYLEEVVSIMKKHGFTAISIHYPKHGRSIDVTGVLDEKKVIIKVTDNVDELSNTEFNDLRRASKAYYASPIVIGNRTKHGYLEDDVVVKKRDVNIVSLELFRKILLYGEKPLVYFFKGNYLVRIDPVKFRGKRKEELGLSLGELAEILGVSRKAVYEYEHGNVDISITTALRIAEVMGEDIFAPIDILNERVDEKKVQPDIPRDRFESKLLEVCREATNDICEIYRFIKTPIDYALKTSSQVISITCRKRSDEDFEDKTIEGMKLSSTLGSKHVVLENPSDISEITRVLNN